MLIELNVQATSEYVSIALPQFDASTVVKNSVAYRVDKNGTRSIVATGEDADSLRNKAPAYLQGNLAKLKFVHPFDVGQFAPEFIEAMLKYYVTLLSADKRQANWFQRLFNDRLILHLSIAEYEKLSLEQRQEFEYTLQKSSLPKIQELIVNGGSLLSPEFLQAKHRFERQRTVADWLLWILRALGMFGLFLLLIRVWPSLPIPSDLLWTFVWLAAALVSIALGDWLALTIWGIVMPRLLPRSVVRTTIAQANVAEIEKTWLERLLREPKPASQHLP